VSEPDAWRGVLEEYDLLRDAYRTFALIAKLSEVPRPSSLLRQLTNRLREGQSSGQMGESGRRSRLLEQIDDALRRRS